MKIVVAARCRDNEEHIERFLHGYSFADAIVISDGGSTDNSINLLKQDKKVILHHFDIREDLGNGYWWNPDAPHMNFVLNKARELEPDWLIFDDIDCTPNVWLNRSARYLFEVLDKKYTQVNVFRLYMWGDTEFFPKMNNNFDPLYTSLWAFDPKRQNVKANPTVRHGTIIGYSETPFRLEPPLTLLHYSWNPKTIDKKLAHYKAVGFQVDHPFNMPNAGKPVPLPDWVME